MRAADRATWNSGARHRSSPSKAEIIPASRMHTLALACPSLTPACEAGLLRRLERPRLVDASVAQHTPVVRLRGWLGEREMSRLHEAARTVRDEVGEVVRANGLKPGSWRTVFMNHRLAHLVPEVHASLHEAAREVDARHWQVIDEPNRNRRSLNLRCAEYHTVLPSGGLPMQKHHDRGSLITMDLMLSTPGADFEGGTFQTLEPDGALRRHAFDRGDALLFLSHKYHCVSPVTRGERTVFVSELWDGLERRCNCRCLQPWGPCYCAYAADPALGAIKFGETCAWRPRRARRHTPTHTRERAAKGNTRR